MSDILFPANRKIVADRMRTDVQYNLPDSSPFLQNNYINALIVGCSGRNFDFYLQLQILLQQMFPDTATGDYALRWGGYVDIDPNAATQASGNIVITGVAGSIVPVGQIYADDDGDEYEVQTQVTLSSQVIAITSLTRSGDLVTATTASPHNLATNITVTIAGAVETDYNGAKLITVTSQTEFTYSISTTPASPATGTITASFVGAVTNVISQDFGEDQNQASGAQLSLTTPISGVNNAAYVTFDEIGGGADEETDDDYKSRYLFRYRQPHALFNSNEIITEAKKVNGVTRVWVEEITPDVGQVTIYFVRDNDETIIPSAGEVTSVKDQILTITPANTSPNDVIVLAPTPVSVDFEFSTLSPNTSAMQQAITENLQALFKQSNNVSQDMVEDTYHCTIFQTIDATGTQVESFSLATPTGDIAINDGEIAILGTITFP
jgi:uncharacterized phage protein gp47/JayE